MTDDVDFDLASGFRGGIWKLAKLDQGGHD